MTNIKISIVTPSFNQANYLEQTINSVLDQKYPNLEYIIIDGGSNDGSVDIIKRYSKYLSYWISEPDHGMYEAIQKGFNRASGHVMSWINSDDMYHPKCLSVVGEIFSTFNEVKWLTGPSTHFDEIGRTVRVSGPDYWNKYRYYCYDFKWIQQESTFWRKTLWEQAGGTLRTDLLLAGDFELWLRFFRYSELYTTNALLGGFRLRSANQKSLNQMNSYLDEVNTLLSVELHTLPRIEKRKVNLINLSKRFLQPIPVIGNRLFDMILTSRLPKRKLIEYDRFTQCFKIT